MNQRGFWSFRIFYGWYILIAAFSVNFIGHGMQHSFGVFLKPLSENFGWSRSLTSGAFMVFMICRGISIFLMGHLSERYGPRPIVVAGGLFIGAGMLLGSIMTDIWEFYVFYGVLVGIGMGVVPVPLTTAISRWFTARRGLIQGIFSSGAGFANLILSPIAGYLIHGFGINRAFMVMGLCALILITLSAMVMRRDPDDFGLRPYGAEVESDAGSHSPHGAESTETTKDWRTSQALRSGSFWVLATVGFVYGIGLYMMRTTIVAYATDGGIPPTTATYLLSIVGGSSAGGMILMGLLTDRISSRTTLVLCLGIQGLVFFAFAGVSSNLILLCVIAAVFGVSSVGVLLQFVVITPEIFGLKSLGTILGLIMFIHILGGAVGSELGNLIYDFTRYRSYSPAFLLGGGFYMAVTALAFIKMPHHRREPGSSGH